MSDDCLPRVVGQRQVGVREELVAWCGQSDAFDLAELCVSRLADLGDHLRAQRFQRQGGGIGVHRFLFCSTIISVGCSRR
jgi:hypothetical protein